MRQFFTLRFWMTLLALGGLALGVAAFTRSRESGAATTADGVAGDGSTERTIDLVSWVYAIQPPPGFGIVDGRTTTDLALVLDGTRTMIIKAGTPGSVDCPGYTELARCTVAADLLGDGVLWFSIVRGAPGATVLLPPVREVLDGGWVRLANGWIVQHAPVIDRSCPDDTGSLKDFIDTFGDNATATFNFEQQEVVKVTCTASNGATTTTSTLPPVSPPGTLDPSATIVPPPLDTSEPG